jgi:ubiquitin-protein ligase
LQGQLAPGLTLVSADDFSEWLMDLRVIDDNPIYNGEVYRLKFKFPNNYPIEVYIFHSPGIQASGRFVPSFHSPCPYAKTDVYAS